MERERNEITKEEIAEFWQWCGFEGIDVLDDGRVYYCIDGIVYWIPLTLDNLFRYAKAKFRDINMHIKIEFVFSESETVGCNLSDWACPPYKKNWRWVVIAAGNDKDPAIALFRAIQEARKEERNGSI